MVRVDQGNPKGTQHPYNVKVIFRTGLQSSLPGDVAHQPIHLFSD